MQHKPYATNAHPKKLKTVLNDWTTPWNRHENESWVEKAQPNTIVKAKNNATNPFAKGLLRQRLCIEQSFTTKKIANQTPATSGRRPFPGRLERKAMNPPRNCGFKIYQTCNSSHQRYKSIFDDFDQGWISPRKSIYSRRFALHTQNEGSKLV